MLSTGLPVKVQYGWGFHHGIADGRGYVIHNSKEQGMVVRVPESVFEDGRSILKSNIPLLNSQAAVSKALEYLGHPYDLFSANCEQFVRLCVGLEIESPQLQKYMLVTAGLSVAAASKNEYAQLGGVAVALTASLSPADESPIPNVLAVLGLVMLGAALASGT